jgi:hypothetical protein
MLQEALKVSYQGARVMIIAADLHHADELLYRICQLEGYRPDGHYREYQWTSVGDRGGRYQIIVWDRHNMMEMNEWRRRLTYTTDPSQHPDVVLIDHAVLEMLYPDVIQNWVRFL